jgi:aminopeptidase N
MDQSGQGPVYLGYRLGHIKGDTRVFRALVYNKGALVLHMLHQMLGDEAFFRGLRRFYAENRFKKAGTDDLQHAMEHESGASLERFFGRWIYEDSFPRIGASSRVDGQELVVRFEQQGEIFDTPILVTIAYSDGRIDEHVVVSNDAAIEKRLPLSGAVRQVAFNADAGALAAIEKRQAPGIDERVTARAQHPQ